MASFTVTVPDSVVPRIEAAFGHWDNTQGAPVWVNGNVEDVQSFLKSDMKNRVLEYETAAVAEDKRDAVNAENW